MITIPHDKINAVHHYLNTEVSKRQYYFHSEFGNYAWKIERSNTDWVLHADVKHETYIALRFL